MKSNKTLRFAPLYGRGHGYTDSYANEPRPGDGNRYVAWFRGACADCGQEHNMTDQGAHICGRE